MNKPNDAPNSNLSDIQEWKNRIAIDSILGKAREKLLTALEGLSPEQQEEFLNTVAVHIEPQGVKSEWDE